MQRREEQAKKHDHQAAEPDDNAVDPGFEFRFDELQILLAGDVVVGIASKISVPIRPAFWWSILESGKALVRESRSVNLRSSGQMCGTLG
jgi:hypothetical protein